MIRRDPLDRRYRERLTGSYLVSLLLHAPFALLAFSVIANSSQEGASESQVGGSIVTVEQRAPVVAQAPAKAQQAAPLPRAPRIAPVQHARAAQPAHQLQPPAHHELSKFAPTAPPNPTPLPQATPLPNAQPTQAVYEPQPQNEMPAVPTVAPTAVAVAVAVTMPPTAAPTPVPTAAPTAKPSPHPPAPTAAPTARPQTPAPATPAVAPSAAVAQPKATVAASATTAAPARASAAPAASPGQPSPSPTQGAAPAKTTGTAPSPGPKGVASPGPRAGSSTTSRPGPSRPVAVSPTASPAPVSSAKPKHNVPDINAKLRGLLPNNPVNPSQGTYHSAVTLNGSMEPTPPPEIVALTKFTYEERGGSGGDARIKMWVTAVRHVGAITMCDGWMLRYPHSSQPVAQTGTFTNPVAGGVQVSAGGNPGGVLKPIVEAHASAVCSQRDLVPFGPSPAASP